MSHLLPFINMKLHWCTGDEKHARHILASISHVYKINISFQSSDFMQLLGHSSK